MAQPTRGPSLKDILEEAARHAGVGGGGAGGTGGGSGRSTSAAVFERLGGLGKRLLIIALIVLLVVIAVAYWWFHPPINVHSADTWMFITIFILAPIWIALKVRSSSHRRGTGKLLPNANKATVFSRLAWLSPAVVVVVILGALVSLPLFPGNAERYAAILNTTSLDFASDIKEVNYSQIPVIDRDSATLLGNRAMGSIPDYVSQFEISPLYSQINYQGNPVRVSPLGYADIFKWLSNRDAGIPAYALVNMTTQDASIVRASEGLHYTSSEPFFRNIERHVQLSYPFYMFDQIAFEIDDEGHPWWICPVQDFTIGLFGGKTISRVVLCDAVTGTCTDLTVAECPQWIDRVYPADLLVEQYNWSGAYKDGWVNSWMGQQGVVQTTPGTNGLLGYNYIAKDDDVWIYTGVTSATADNSIVGFVLVNQRTAESHFYAVAGATEESAMNSAAGQVQHLRYYATFPLLININGQPTYFMALKDDAGLVKMFAMIDIQRYQNVAIGDTVAACQESYKTLLSTNGIEDPDAEKIETLQATGVIARITQAVVEGNSHFYVQLEGNSRIYDFALPQMIAIIAYEEGDPIAFTYEDTGSPAPVIELKDS